MESDERILITLGALTLVGLAASVLGDRTRLPRVTLLLLFGVVSGPEVFDILPDDARSWFPIASSIALVMVGFLLGEHLTPRRIRGQSRPILVTSLAVTLATVIAVFLASLAIGAPVEVALVLAAAASATDPAATVSVVQEARAEGPVSRTLLGVVAVDDLWGIMLFAVAIAGAGIAIGDGSQIDVLASAAWQVGGAVLLGIGLGAAMSQLTGRIQEGEPTLLEAVGVVLLCGGLAIWMDVSLILAAMVMGMTVASIALHHTRPFHAIEGIEAPFLGAFFFLAGASLDIDALGAAGALAVGYFCARAVGRVVGGWLSSSQIPGLRVSGAWVGLALFPQAGVALGMALVATQRFPELEADVLPVVVAATVLFELSGPILTRLALARVGEAGRAAPADG